MTARAWWASVGEAIVTASTTPISADASVRWVSAPCCAAISAARAAIDVDHGGQHRAGRVAEDPRVVPPERPDPDHSHPYRVSHVPVLREDARRP